MSDTIAEAYRQTFGPAHGKAVVDDLASYISKLEAADRAGATLVLTRIMLRGEPRRVMTAKTED